MSEWPHNNGTNTRPLHGQYTQNSPGHAPGHTRLRTPLNQNPRNSPAASNSPYSEQQQNQNQHPLHRTQYAPATYETHPVSPEGLLSVMTQNETHILSSNTDSGGYDQYAAHSSFLLDLLDAGGYYDAPSSTSMGDTTTSTNRNTTTNIHSDFQLDSMEFVAPQYLGHESRAFPPLAYAENTPALGPSDRGPLLAPVVFQSPILPSQNSKSYNQEHLLQKQRQQQQRLRLLTPMMMHQQLHQQNQHQQLHIGTDHGFTPLVSPAVTPRELQVNVNMHNYAPAVTDFEPLTSPALKAQPAELDRRRPLAAMAGDDYTHGSSAKRRTPHLTPKLLALTLLLKVKPSPSLRKLPQQYDLVLDSQQQQQQQQQHAPSSALALALALNDTPLRLRSSELTPMLPPQGKKAPIEVPPKPAPGFGPGMIMGFTMNRLAEQQGADGNNTPGLDSPLVVSHASSERMHRHLGSMSAPAFSSLSETSPMLEAMTGEQGEQSEQGSGKRDRFPAKKTSHKIAEQGRRIRMNQAVHELSRLIPDTFHEGITVPSKATTIEMAAVYIRNLQHEIESLKKRD